VCLLGRHLPMSESCRAAPRYRDTARQFCATNPCRANGRSPQSMKQSESKNKSFGFKCTAFQFHCVTKVTAARGSDKLRRARLGGRGFASPRQKRPAKRLRTFHVARVFNVFNPCLRRGTQLKSLFPVDFLGRTSLIRVTNVTNPCHSKGEPAGSLNLTHEKTTLLYYTYTASVFCAGK